jgi:hypothetical protein
MTTTAIRQPDPMSINRTDLTVDVVDGMGLEVNGLDIAVEFELTSGRSQTITQRTDVTGTARFRELHEAPVHRIAVIAAGESHELPPGEQRLLVEV